MQNLACSAVNGSPVNFRSMFFFILSLAWMSIRRGIVDTHVVLYVLMVWHPHPDCALLG
jgi:ribose/xylose/arabinose/galactoside ABC-type transport system permease subunit